MGGAESYSTDPGRGLLRRARQDRADPYFGGAGPQRRAASAAAPAWSAAARTPRTRWTRTTSGRRAAGACAIMPERTVVRGSARSAHPTAPTATPWRATAPAPGCASQRQVLTARGVVVAAGPLGTNQLLPALPGLGGSLPRLSPARRPSRPQQQRGDPRPSQRLQRRPRRQARRVFKDRSGLPRALVHGWFDLLEETGRGGRRRLGGRREEGACGSAGLEALHHPARHRHVPGRADHRAGPDARYLSNAASIRGERRRAAVFRGAGGDTGGVERARKAARPRLRGRHLHRERRHPGRYGRQQLRRDALDLLRDDGRPDPLLALRPRRAARPSSSRRSPAKRPSGGPEAKGRRPGSCATPWKWENGTATR